LRASNPFAQFVGAAAHGFGEQLARDLSEMAESEDGDDSADKSIEEVYRDRNLLAFALCRAVADAHGKHNVGWYEHNEWAVVTVRLPTGTVSWHVRPETVPQWIPERDPGEWYDGHDRDEKNQRVEQYAKRQSGEGSQQCEYDDCENTVRDRSHCSVACFLEDCDDE
jgi:hypothetical protein